MEELHRVGFANLQDRCTKGFDRHSLRLALGAHKQLREDSIDEGLDASSQFRGEMRLTGCAHRFADKIKTPILLIHGEADDNTGTFPIQSERLYAAIRGNGGTARLVMLPNEAHGYRGEETMEHVLYEELAWFDKYLK
jgi:alpha-beta hydrolase superfamily lysophospholipase